MATYAIVESGGKQYRVEKGETVVVDRLPVDQGAKVTLRPVMYRGEGEVVLERGELDRVKVEAVVSEHLRGEKVRIFKYKPKKRYRRRAGHRSELTRLEVTEVRKLSRKPAAKKAEPKKAEGKAKAPAKAQAKPKKATSRKSSAKKGG